MYKTKTLSFFSRNRQNKIRQKKKGNEINGEKKVDQYSQKVNVYICNVACVNVHIYRDAAAQEFRPADCTRCWMRTRGIIQDDLHER